MYRVKYNLCPCYKSDIFYLIRDRSYSLRNSDNFMISRINTITSWKDSIRYIGTIIWFKVRMRIKSSETLTSFKNQVREPPKNCHL